MVVIDIFKMGFYRRFDHQGIAENGLAAVVPPAAQFMQGAAP